MPKETYYFPHDANAHNDPKISALIQEHGLQGYGFYWMLIEIMHQEGGMIEKFPKLYTGLAHQFRCELETVELLINALVTDYHLLEANAKQIWSNRVKRNFEERLRRSKTRADAGRLGGIKSGESRHSKTTPSKTKHLLEANEANEAKERKGKERKEEIHIRVTPEKIKNGSSVAHATGQVALYEPILKTNKTAIADFIRDNKPTLPDPYVDLWNLFAAERKLPSIAKLNDVRKRKLAIRLRESGFDFLAILRRAAKSDFVLQGNWFGFDWIIENDKNYLKVLEGNYDNKINANGQHAHAERQGAKLANAVAQIEAGLKP